MRENFVKWKFEVLEFRVFSAAQTFCNISMSSMQIRYHACVLRSDTLMRRQVHRSVNARNKIEVSEREVKIAVTIISKFQDSLRSINIMT
jgi:hypothetical protein